MAKCCHALRTHQHAQGGRVAARARPAGRGNEAASSEPSIYSVRTVERIIGHSLHGQSRGSGAESERARRRPACLPSWAQARHVSSGVHFGRKEVILYSLRSVQHSLPTHPLALTRFPFMLAPTCPHATAYVLSFTLYQSVLAIYSPCEVAVLLHHRSVPPSKIVARGKAALFIRAVILQSLCRAHM